MYRIDIANQQTSLTIDEPRLKKAVEAVLKGESIRSAQVSLAVVDDDTIHGLNRQYLGHDCPTDVLSFLLERDGDRLEGEVIVSAETAAASAADFGWSAEDELLLYVIHGILHLTGCLDGSPAQQREMQSRERAYLAQFGLSDSYQPL